MSCPDGVHKMKRGINDGQIEDATDWSSSSGGNNGTGNGGPERCQDCGAFMSPDRPCVRCENLRTMLRSTGMPEEDAAQLATLVGKTPDVERREVLAERLEAMGYSQHKDTAMLAMDEYESEEAQNGYPDSHKNGYVNGQVNGRVNDKIDGRIPPIPLTETPDVNNTDPELEKAKAEYEAARATFIAAIGERSLDEDGHLTPGYEAMQGTPLYKKYEAARSAYREATGLDDDPDVQIGEMRDGRYTVPRPLLQDLQDRAGLSTQDAAELRQRFQAIGKESARQQNHRIKTAVQQKLEAEGLEHLTDEVAAIMTGARQEQPGQTSLETRARTRTRPQRVISEATRQKLREAAKRRQRCPRCGAFLGQTACKRCDRLRAMLEEAGIHGERLEQLVRELGGITRQIEAQARARNHELMSREAQSYLAEVSKGDYALAVNNTLNHHLGQPLPDEETVQQDVDRHIADMAESGQLDPDNNALSSARNEVANLPDNELQQELQAAAYAQAAALDDLRQSLTTIAQAEKLLQNPHLSPVQRTQTQEMVNEFQEQSDLSSQAYQDATARLQAAEEAAAGPRVAYEVTPDVWAQMDHNVREDRDEYVYTPQAAQIDRVDDNGVLAGFPDDAKEPSAAIHWKVQSREEAIARQHELEVYRALLEGRDVPEAVRETYPHLPTARPSLDADDRDYRTYVADSIAAVNAGEEHLVRYYQARQVALQDLAYHMTGDGDRTIAGIQDAAEQEYVAVTAVLNGATPPGNPPPATLTPGRKKEDVDQTPARVADAAARGEEPKLRERETAEQVATEHGLSVPAQKLLGAAYVGGYIDDPAEAIAVLRAVQAIDDGRSPGDGAALATALQLGGSRQGIVNAIREAQQAEAEPFAAYARTVLQAYDSQTGNRQSDDGEPEAAARPDQAVPAPPGISRAGQTFTTEEAERLTQIQGALADQLRHTMRNNDDQNARIAFNRAYNEAIAGILPRDVQAVTDQDVAFYKKITDDTAVQQALADEMYAQIRAGVYEQATPLVREAHRRQQAGEAREVPSPVERPFASDLPIRLNTREARIIDNIRAEVAGDTAMRQAFADNTDDPAKAMQAFDKRWGTELAKMSQYAGDLQQRLTDDPELNHALRNQVFNQVWDAVNRPANDNRPELGVKQVFRHAGGTYMVEAVNRSRDYVLVRDLTNRDYDREIRYPNIAQFEAQVGVRLRQGTYEEHALQPHVISHDGQAARVGNFVGHDGRLRRVAHIDYDNGTVYLQATLDPRSPSETTKLQKTSFNDFRAKTGTTIPPSPKDVDARGHQHCPRCGKFVSPGTDCAHCGIATSSLEWANRIDGIISERSQELAQSSDTTRANELNGEINRLSRQRDQYLGVTREQILARGDEAYKAAIDAGFNDDAARQLSLAALDGTARPQEIIAIANTIQEIDEDSNSTQAMFDAVPYGSLAGLRDAATNDGDPEELAAASRIVAALPQERLDNVMAGVVARQKALAHGFGPKAQAILQSVISSGNNDDIHVDETIQIAKALREAGYGGDSDNQQELLMEAAIQLGSLANVQQTAQFHENRSHQLMAQQVLEVFGRDQRGKDWRDDPLVKPTDTTAFDAGVRVAREFGADSLHTQDALGSAYRDGDISSLSDAIRVARLVAKANPSYTPGQAILHSLRVFGGSPDWIVEVAQGEINGPEKLAQAMLALAQTESEIATHTPQEPEAKTKHQVEHEGSWTWVSFPDAGKLSKAEREKQYRPIFDALKNEYRARYSKKRNGWYIRRHVDEEDIARIIAESEPKKAEPNLVTAPTMKPKPASIPALTIPDDARFSARGEELNPGDYFQHNGADYRYEGYVEADDVVLVTRGDGVEDQEIAWGNIEGEGGAENFTSATGLVISRPIITPENGPAFGKGDTVDINNRTYEVIGVTATRQGKEVTLKSINPHTRHESTRILEDGYFDDRAAVRIRRDAKGRERCPRCQSFVSPGTNCKRCERFIETAAANSIAYQDAEGLAAAIQDYRFDRKIDAPRDNVYTYITDYDTDIPRNLTLEQLDAVVAAAQDYVEDDATANLRQELRRLGFGDDQVDTLRQAIDDAPDAAARGQFTDPMEQAIQSASESGRAWQRQMIFDEDEAVSLEDSDWRGAISRATQVYVGARNPDLAAQVNQEAKEAAATTPPPIPEPGPPPDEEPDTSAPASQETTPTPVAADSAVTMPQQRKRRRPMQVSIETLLEKHGLLEDLQNDSAFYAKFENEGWQPLTIERLGDNRVAVTHWGSYDDGKLYTDTEIVYRLPDWTPVEMTQLPVVIGGRQVGGGWQPIFTDDGRYYPQRLKGARELSRVWAKNLRHQGWMDDGKLVKSRTAKPDDQAQPAATDQSQTAALPTLTSANGVTVGVGDEFVVNGTRYRVTDIDSDAGDMRTQDLSSTYPIGRAWLPGQFEKAEATLVHKGDTDEAAAIQAESTAKEQPRCPRCGAFMSPDAPCRRCESFINTSMENGLSQEMAEAWAEKIQGMMADADEPDRVFVAQAILQELPDDIPPEQRTAVARAAADYVDNEEAATFRQQLRSLGFSEVDVNNMIEAVERDKEAVAAGEATRRIKQLGDLVNTSTQTGEAVLPDEEFNKQLMEAARAYVLANTPELEQAQPPRQPETPEQHRQRVLIEALERDNLPNVSTVNRLMGIVRRYPFDPDNPAGRQEVISRRLKAADTELRQIGIDDPEQRTLILAHFANHAVAEATEIVPDDRSLDEPLAYMNDPKTYLWGALRAHADLTPTQAAQVMDWVETGETGTNPGSLTNEELRASAGQMATVARILATYREIKDAREAQAPFNQLRADLAGAGLSDGQVDEALERVLEDSQLARDGYSEARVGEYMDEQGINNPDVQAAVNQAIANYKDRMADVWAQRLEAALQDDAGLSQAEAAAIVNELKPLDLVSDAQDFETARQAIQRLTPNQDSANLVVGIVSDSLDVRPLEPDTGLDWDDRQRDEDVPTAPAPTAVKDPTAAMVGVEANSTTEERQAELTRRLEQYGQEAGYGEQIEIHTEKRKDGGTNYTIIADGEPVAAMTETSAVNQTNQAHNARTQREKEQRYKPQPEAAATEAATYAGPGQEHCANCGAFKSPGQDCQRCANLRSDLTDKAGFTPGQADRAIAALAPFMQDATLDDNDPDRLREINDAYQDFLREEGVYDDTVRQNDAVIAATRFMNELFKSRKEGDNYYGRSDSQTESVDRPETDGAGTLAEVSADDVPPVRGDGSTRERAGRGRRTDDAGSTPASNGDGVQRVRGMDGSQAELRDSAGRSRRGDGRGRADQPGAVDRDNRGDGRGRIKPGDYRISDSDKIGDGGLKQKYKDNVAAIKTLKQIETEGRQATPEEQAILVKYVGWGGLSQVFDSYQAASWNKNAQWRDEYHELRELLDDEEYEAARATTKNAHYTSPTVVKGMWQALDHMGYRGGRVLEPSAGIGHFVGLMPDHIHTQSETVAVEIDALTGRILGQLYQDADTRITGYEEANLPNNFFDVAVGNVPFGDYGVYDPSYTRDRKRLTKRIHNYFFAKALDQVKAGGVVAFVTSRYTMDSTKHRYVREYLASQADLVGAIRLPNTAFKKNANTEVTTDIIFLRKREDGEEPNDVSWVDTAPMTVPNSRGGETDIEVNQYFHDNPDMMMGRMEATGSMYSDAQPQLVEDDRDLDKALAEAIQGLPADIAPKRELERCPACQAFLPATGACANPKCPTKRDVYKPAPVDLTAQEDAYVIDDEDGMVYQRKGSRLVRVETTQKEAEAAEAARDTAYDALPGGAIAVKGQKKLQKGFTNLKNSDEYQAYLQAQDNLRDIRGRFNDMERVKAMIPVRDAADEVLQLNLANASNAELEAARERLNQVYDAFVTQYGYLNDYNNFKAMRDDPGLDRLMSLEHNIQTEGRKVVSADKMAIFDRRTIRLTERPESADTALDALMISLNEYGEPNLGRMSELTGRSREDVANELLEQGHIYFSPDGNWVTRDEYLSGSVREKLRQAQAAAALDPQYERNVEALRQVQPEAIPPEDIYVGFGAGWIPPSDMKAFLQEEIFNRWDDVDVRYMPETGTWFMAADVNSWSTNNTREWGIPEAPATRLIDDGLNNRQTTVYKVVGKDENGRNIRVVDEEKTYEAREKQKKIIQHFQKWIWADETRAARLAQIYNEKFNAYVPRQYDGSHLTFPGLADGVFGYDANGRPHELRPHQKNAAWRMIQNDSSLLAHIVGSGKTATMIAGAMEMRRMGISKKPMITVPNHMPEQFAEDWRRMYPAANILVIDSDKLKPSEKAKTMNQIATGDWDGIVITHSAFTRIPVSAEARASFIREEISKLRLFLEEVQGEESNYGYGRSKKQHKKTVKQIEKAISRLETQLKKNLNSPKEEGVLEWEELGVDTLMVDEAHMFKNLFTATKMTRVAGVKANVGSKRAMDMFIKTQYLQRRCQCGRFVSPSGICQNCGNKAEIVKGKVIFATGTPVTNSMGEVYTMQRYLQRDTLETAGLGHFDAWANQFGEMVTSIEMKPSGKGFRQKTRFARFHNVPELMRMWAEVADIQQDPEKMGLPRPLLRGGDPTAYEAARRRFVEFAGGPEALNRFDKLADDYQHLKDTSQYQEFLAARLEYRKAMTVSVPMNKYQEAIIDKCDERAENLPPDPSVDNMLKIVNDARLASLDVRLINPNLPDDPNSKVNVCVRRMVDIYHETTNVELPGVEGKHNMAQMLFLDTGTPGGANLNLYKDIKQKLIAEGVPEDEIAFIHDAGDDKAKKLELFHKINRGELRFLFGSTEKMGTGTNAQRLLTALHHLDVPWRPDQIEQREGRIVRQGNLNPEVEVFRYGTEKSFDVYMWQTNETKAGFIFQVMNGDPTIRSMEDIDEAQIGYAQAKAIFSGNPEAMEIVQVEADLRKLEALGRAHRNTRRDLRWELDNIPKQRQNTRMMADRYREAAAAVRWPKQKDEFAMTVSGRTYDKRLEAGEALVDIITKNKNERGRVMFTGEIGNLYGARITLESNETELKKSGRDYGRAVIEIGRVREKIDLGTSAEGNVTRMINVLKRLEEKQREHEQTLADLDEREPKIRALLEQPFEKAEELERTRQRYEELHEVVSKLEAEGERKQSIDESFGGQDKDDDNDDAETAEYTTDMDVSDLLEMAQA